jgi:hypothetical protein
MTAVVLMHLLCMHMHSLTTTETTLLAHAKVVDMNDMSDLPTEYQNHIREEYKKQMKSRKADSKKNKNKSNKDKSSQSSLSDEERQYKEQHQEAYKAVREMASSPRKQGIKRDEDGTSVALTRQVFVDATTSKGYFYMGSNLDIKGKVYPATMKDGSAPRKRVKIRLLIS